MKRLLKWTIRLVGAIVILVAALVAYVYVASGNLMARTYAVQPPQVPIPTDPASIARGKYLAENVAVCTECHGPDFGGKVVDDNFAMGRLVATNLTRGRGGLPADYSDQDFVRVLTHGVKRDGRSVIFMPTAEYVFTPEDLGAIVAYVKSVPPVDRSVPTMSPGPMARALGLFVDFPLASASMIDHSQPRLAARPDAADAVAAGKYLVSSAGCYGCHGAQLTGGSGPPPGGANITPVGIGDWSERDFTVALKTHRRPNGSAIDEVMPRAYGEMSDQTSPGSTPTCGPCRPPGRRRRASRRRLPDRRRPRHVERASAMIVSMAGWRLEHTFAELPELFYSDAAPTPVRDPRLVAFNRPLATALGLELEALEGADGAAIFAGNALPDGGRPIAQAYAGHQFGHFTTLGDGRAILLGEQITPRGARLDIQLKGAGRTRFSRGGDGRAALGPMLREYIISEAMHALGIPTTRSLAVVTTGEPVYRETMLQGAVLTRVAGSHIRVGTMQWAAAYDDDGAVQALADYTRARHYTELAESPDPYIALFDAIVARQAALIARWQLVGFIHGVMNTDNMALSGETIDYGPCAFMDAYDPATVFSSIDHGGRYAYGNQPAIARWNLARCAEAMLPLFDQDADRAAERATAVLDLFATRFEQHWLDGMRAKLGLFTQEADDRALVDDLLAWMQRSSADFTNTFRLLTAGRLVGDSTNADPELAAWHHRWEARRRRQPQVQAEVNALMRSHNPAFIPRNHNVEAALQAATEGRDLSVMARLLEVLATPYDHDQDLPAFSVSDSAERPYRTFCGT